MASTSFGKSAARISVAVRPVRLTVAPTYSPFAVVTLARAPTSTPAFLAKASAALVGAPSLKATAHEGPVSCSSISACADSTPSTSAARRRGVEYVVTVPPSARSRSRASRSVRRFPSSASAEAIIRAGISSRPISRRKNAMIRFPDDARGATRSFFDSAALRSGGQRQRVLRGLLEGVGFGDAYGKVADAANDADAFCDADGAASIEQVEQV